MNDTNGNALVPGHVYAVMVLDEFISKELVDMGVFVVYGSDGKLYDVASDEDEEGPIEITSDLFDALVEQTGSYIHEYSQLGSPFYANEKAMGMMVTDEIARGAAPALATSQTIRELTGKS